MDLKDFLPIVIAALALVIAGLSLWHSYRKDRDRLFNFRAQWWIQEQGSGADHATIIDIVNTGSATVVVESIWIIRDAFSARIWTDDRRTWPTGQRLTTNIERRVQDAFFLNERETLTIKYRRLRSWQVIRTRTYNVAALPCPTAEIPSPDDAPRPGPDERLS